MNKPHTIMEDEVLVAWNKRSARKPQQTPKVPSYVGEVIAVTSHIQTYAQNEIEKLLATALEEQRLGYIAQVKELSYKTGRIEAYAKVDDLSKQRVVTQDILSILNGKEA